MHEAIFTLRQDTVLIHFLPNQPGATLRATELKPKLDNWITSRNPDLHPDWILKSEPGHTSLNYKVSILPTGQKYEVNLQITEKPDRETGQNKFETTAFPHLLGNMGGKEYKEDIKNLVLYDGAEIRIKTWHQPLLDRIVQALPELFAQENFGNRSGKGFGSFACTHVNRQPIQRRPTLPYCFDWETQGNTPLQSQKDLFMAMNWFYKCLRSGINQVNSSGKTEFYFKSLMFAYAETKKDRWDKYSIKNHFFEGGTMPPVLVDYRDWLGLSTEEMWGRKYNNQKINKSAEDSGIDRFASPILFKPVKIQGNRYRIWFGIVPDFPKEEFAQAKIKVENKKSSQAPLYLTPSPKFDFDEFFRFAFTEVDLEEYLDRFDKDDLNPTNHKIYKEFIRPVFQSIQQNLNARV